MATAVRLTVLTGPHKNLRFCFCGPTRCQVGRALNCYVNFSGAARDELISRYHCQLDIDPPSIQIRDLGSTNGTYVNGAKVTFGPTEQSALTGAAVNHGDLVTIGDTTLRVDILNCPNSGNAPDVKSIWEEGTTAIKACPLPC